MRRFGISLFALLLGATVLATGASSVSTKRPRHVSAFGEYAVRFKPGTSPQAMAAVVAAVNATVIEDMHQISALEVASTDPNLLAKLTTNPLVVAAFVDGVGPSANSQLGGASSAPTTQTSTSTSGDPLHDAYQWDDAHMNVPPASATRGAGVKVAVVDSGVDTSQHETAPSSLGQTNFIPCDALASVLGKAQVSRFLGISDCDNEDNDGHGTWLASRIAGALNGFASNGIAPGAGVIDNKALAVDYGFDSAWVIAALLNACDRGANVVNLSLVEYNDPTDRDDAQDYLLWADAASYCRSKGSVLVAAAGNDHVRIDRVSTRIAGRSLSGVGIVSSGNDGFGLPQPGGPLGGNDLRGLLEVPAGLPGVIMVSSTGNATADATGAVDPAFRFAAGLTDQLAYYSNYGSRVDIAAPGGARSFNVPSYDASSGDGFTAGFGVFGGTDPQSELCDTSLGTGCFTLKGDGFMWLQGTSQATANVSGAVAALLSAKPTLNGNPSAVLSRLQGSARRTMRNVTGPLSPSTAPTLIGPCSGFCHVDTQHPLSFSDAYGAGLVDVGKLLS
jgi:lantibiotic leader peptide-processing serine protease